ncbi:MAG: DEAD/DEAH box helicase family protein [bacterium]
MDKLFDEALFKKINLQKDTLKKFNPEVLEIPHYIKGNLRHTFFDWQNQAMENFLFYENPKTQLKKTPTHLMFNMATGTGKTLLMAACILYYYKQGYRHFIFFVNQNNIIDKTENNFIEKNHTKYLFKENIIFDNKTVNIKKVETFSDEPQGIEIKFTSIQMLYNDIHLEKENKTTLDDLHKRNIVMLADEAHHLNAETKSKNGYQEQLIITELTNKSSAVDKERKGWEHTVIHLILNKNGNGKTNKNVLLEFTATIPTDISSVWQKYKDKIVYEYNLQKFLQAGFTKEINLISSTLNKKERILQALLFHWYRHKIALKNGIANFKPVILFRSKTIEESKNDYKEFVNWTSDISATDFEFLKTISEKINESKVPSLFEMGKSRTEQVLEYINSEEITYSEIAKFIKDNFKEDVNIIITNSETNKTKSEITSEEQEKLLNSLEDKNNHIRAIFTVDRLTEGWDVLNLFDIVRLYQGQNAGGSTNKTPEATVKEKQLIGRGVRYFPFQYKDKIKNKRKFDDDLKNELRVLEELYYYTYDEESRYISHLKDELKKEGYLRDDRIIKTFSIKNDFKESDFYKKSILWYNEQFDNPNKKKITLDKISKNFFSPYKIKGFEISEQEVDFTQNNDIQRLEVSDKQFRTYTIKLSDIEKHIIRKAINIKAKQEGSLFQYINLKDELEINSVDDFYEKIFGDFDINIVTAYNQKFEDIPNKELLNLVLKFLDDISNEIKQYSDPYQGGEFIAGNFENFFGEPKTKTINEDKESIKLETNLKNTDWYVLDGFYGTSEEIGLIEFIQENFGNLKDKYSEIYLLRNEELYKIHDFDHGWVFYPDFLLFLRSKDNDSLYYQVIIESKGDQFLDDNQTFIKGKEGWKEEFLEQIQVKYGYENVIKYENPNYKLIGFPFYNQTNIENFKSSFNNLL